MKSKTQTPLGYLMGLLDIRLQDLSDFLYISQTSVSKWKTGARTLPPDSPHVDGIVEFMTLLVRDPGKREKLLGMLSDVYPDQALDAPGALSLCVRAFLSGRQLPSDLPRLSSGKGKALYTAEFAVFRGAQGFEGAVSRLLSQLKSCEKGASLSVLDPWKQALGARLLPALDAGCRVRLLLCGVSGLSLTDDLAAVFSHAHLEARLLADGAPAPDRALYAADGVNMAVVSREMPGKARYTALYTDEMTVDCCREAFDALWQSAKPLFSETAPESLTPDTLSRALEITVPERIDWLVPSLPHMTMGRQLLMEVLEQNRVSGRAWARVLGCQGALLGVPLRFFMPVSALRAMPDASADLRFSAGVPIALTQAQARRHLLDTAALLRAGQGVGLILLQGETPKAWGRAGMCVRRNAFVSYQDVAARRVLTTKDPSFIEQAMRETDRLFAGTTRQLRDQAYVAGLLERAALLP